MKYSNLTEVRNIAPKQINIESIIKLLINNSEIPREDFIQYIYRTKSPINNESAWEFICKHNANIKITRALRICAQHERK